MNIYAIILAAGNSSRLAAQNVATPKQFQDYNGIPLFWHSAKVFAKIPQLKGILFVFPPELPDALPFSGSIEAETPLISTYTTYIKEQETSGPLNLPWSVALGGDTRQASVRNGLASLPDSCDTLLVHDSARPFVTAQLTQAILDALAHGHKAVIPAVAVTDTIKQVNAAELVEQTLPRACLRAVQTPQGFERATLEAAHSQAAKVDVTGTDDAQLVEQLGVPVFVVPGDTANCKITYKADMDKLSNSSSFPSWVPCSGFGYDVHRYGGTRPFILGGVPIQTDITITAHSDGDTLLHALMDALLGCLGGGDIGALFPDTDAAFDGISSGILLSEVLDRVQKAEIVLTHIDVTIIAQVPKISPHRQGITKNLSKILGLDSSCINVKATTEEHLGFTGEKKGIKVAVLVSAMKRAQV